MSKFCANCGAEVSDGFAFCEKCGTPVQAPENQAPSYNAPQYGPAAKQENNGMAIGGFVCSLVGFLCCQLVTPVGLILSIIGLSKSKQMNGSGKGLAIAGIIIGAIGVAIFILTIILYAIGAVGSVVESNY
jgi:uncharacterized membrane protein YvbJ